MAGINNGVYTKLKKGVPSLIMCLSLSVIGRVLCRLNLSTKDLLHKVKIGLQILVSENRSTMTYIKP